MKCSEMWFLSTVALLVQFWCISSKLNQKNFNNFQKLDYSRNSDNLIKKESLGLLNRGSYADGTQLQLSNYTKFNKFN